MNLTPKMPDKKAIIGHFKTFTKYAMVGTVATAVDLGFLYVFVESFELQVVPASISSFLIANITSFFLNKFWTFESQSKNYRKLYIKFFSVSLVGIGITAIMMHLLPAILGIWYMFAKVLTSMIVVFWNFLANKLWTFKLKPKEVDIPREFSFEYSIVIPAYNEENRIKSTLLVIDDYIKSANISAEIIVVSDGSKDKTNEVVNSYIPKIHHLHLESYEKNQGKGFAVKTGINASKGRYILFTDADNSTPIEELENLTNELKKQKSDIAIGSRYLKKSKVVLSQSAFRIWIGRTGNRLIRWFLIDNIMDTQCGFKLFKHKCAKEIFALQKIKRFGFDMEALVVAKSLGYKITEVPVSWYNSVQSRVRPVKDALNTLKELIYIKLNLWGGRYNAEDIEDIKN